MTTLLLLPKNYDLNVSTAGSVTLRSLGVLVLALPLLLEVVVAGGWVGITVVVGCTVVEMFVPLSAQNKDSRK